MKSKTRLLFPCLLTVAFASLAGVASAADGTKADNTNALNDPLSWVLSTPPTSGTGTMIVDAAMANDRTAPLGDNLSVIGITYSSSKILTIGNTATKALTIGANGITMTGNRLSFENAVTLGSSQSWSLGSGRVNVNNTLTTGGNTLGVSGSGTTSGILSFAGNNTLGTEVTIGTMDRVYVQSGTVTFNGTNNTNSNFYMFGGTANIASMGMATFASSIGKGSAYVQSGATLNYTGNTFSSDKAVSRDANGTSTITVATAGQTLSMSGNLTTATATTTGGWALGGAGNLTLTGNITNAASTTVTKNDAGTVTLSGANTYTGATSVTAGTLALVGGSQASPITVSSGAALGFTLGSPTTSTSTVTFSGATPKVTVSGTPVAATLMTASGMIGIPVLNPAIPGFSLVTTPTELNLVSTAAQGTKADNGDDLNLTTSWVGGTKPTAATYMFVDTTLTVNQTSLLGDNLSVLGIIASSAKNLVINNTPGKTLTIGSSGIISSGAGTLTFSNATSLGGNITMASTATGAITFGGALTLTANQTWALGSTGAVNNRININGGLTTGGNTLGISSASATQGILSLNSTTLGTDVTIGTLGSVYSNGGTVTINGTNNTNTSFSLFSGTANIASMGNLTGASSIGKGSAYVRNGNTLNYTGNTFSSDKGFSRDNNNSGATTDSTINVTTAGQTLSMSGNLTNAANAISGWTFGGAGNLTLSGVIGNSTGTGTPVTKVTKQDVGTLTLSGPNTYSGATAVNGGTLALVGGSQASPITVSSGAALGFTLGSPTTSSSTVTFSGATAKVTVSGTPVAATLMTASGITGTPVLDPAIPGFALQVTATQLNLVASGTPYDTWAALYLPANVSNPAGDNDNDGLVNQQEFAFGLNPTSGSSVNPVLVQLDKATGTFTYQRRAATGLTYSILKSTTLATGSWSLAGATQVAGAVDGNGNQTVLVTLPGAPLTDAKLFVRVSAE